MKCKAKTVVCKDKAKWFVTLKGYSWENPSTHKHGITYSVPVCGKCVMYNHELYWDAKRIDESGGMRSHM